MRFLINRCAGTRLAEWLRKDGHDVVEAREREPDPGDEALLQWAASEARILVTNDKDFGEFVFRDAMAHCGLIRLPDVPAEQRIAIVAQVLARHANDLLGRAVVTIRGGRIRVSKSPDAPN